MPPLLLANQEHFCQLVAKGEMTRKDAHVAAGFDHNNPAVAAFSLCRKRHIQDRIKEIQAEFSPEPALPEFETSQEGLIAELGALERVARKKNDITAARNCIDLIAKMKGYLIERKISMTLNPLENMTADDLTKLLRAADQVLSTNTTSITVAPQQPLKSLPAVDDDE